MEVLELLHVLGSNLCVLVLGWAIYAATGYLLFSNSLKVSPFLIRLNLYPLLGWAFLVTFAYYLRVLALPYSISGPWCLGLLLLGLIILQVRTQRTHLRRPLPWVLLLLAGFLALNLVPLYLRLAIPDMRDVGSWGYDQRNYVLTTAGLLDEGLLPGMPHSKTPWGLFAPYWEYVTVQFASAWLRQALGTRLVLTPICSSNLTRLDPLPGILPCSHAAPFPRWTP